MLINILGRYPVAPVWKSRTTQFMALLDKRLTDGHTAHPAAKPLGVDGPDPPAEQEQKSL